jgi:hypothetical protein
MPAKKKYYCKRTTATDTPSIGRLVKRAPGKNDLPLVAGTSYS